MSDPQNVAAAWLSTFAPAIAAGDVAATVATILPHGWLRDVLTFTWEPRSLEGHAKITSYLSTSLPNAAISNLKLEDRDGLRPHVISDSTVGTGFTFETPAKRGLGFALLHAPEDSSSVWKALSVSLFLDEIKGHEEIGPSLGVYGGHTISWEEVNGEQIAKVESDPQVVIIGAGQTGLNIAARFKQMNIPSLIVERSANVGDQWRQRYPTLSLHTIRNHHELLYQPYPRNWPMYTPRDKVADWLQQYPVSQDLIVWTSSYILPGAKYDHERKRWTIIVNKNGTEVELHPVHIVVSIGTLGKARIPDIPGADKFGGIALHASTYMGGLPYAGKRALVVGAGNTAADMCQDLAFRGAKSVTMLQRSTTCVVSSSTVRKAMMNAFPNGRPLEISDFKFFAVPISLQRRLAVARKEQLLEQEKFIHEPLTKAGLKLNWGVDGSGQHFLIFERAGGFWIDVGVTEMIGDGRVKVKQGVEIARFTENSAISQTALNSNSIWLFGRMTGYTDPRDSLRETFGAEVIDNTEPLWGLDGEGEIRGSYRRSGHPGLWYSAGDFQVSRCLSKQLALQIKAIELGLMPN
ncbi:FAD/NAD-P-binding domain-containing protein [Amylocystis lapponica]|nr:FAD/NAD-P-binding domain-containing protein [Amylocystis lapponica]